VNTSLGKTVEVMAIHESDLDARLMEDMDPKLFDFLKVGVNSFIKWDLVRFFHENPNTADTAADIARYAGRTPEDIEKELAELVQAGILNQESVGVITVYSLSADPTVRDLIDQFVTSCSDRHFRVKVIYHVIHRMETLG
jgi:hypothetical protein